MGKINFIFKETNVEIIKKINEITYELKTEVLSNDQKEELIYQVQNYQNELNLRLAAHSTKIVKSLSIITILLTIFTILLTMWTIVSDANSKLNDLNIKNKEIDLLENIYYEMKNKP